MVEGLIILMFFSTKFWKFQWQCKQTHSQEDYSSIKGVDQEGSPGLEVICLAIIGCSDDVFDLRHSFVVVQLICLARQWENMPTCSRQCHAKVFQIKTKIYKYFVIIKTFYHMYSQAFMQSFIFKLFKMKSHTKNGHKKNIPHPQALYIQYKKIGNQAQHNWLG